MSDKTTETLISQITEILNNLDEESLIFLKEQADVLQYNMKVRERNAEIAAEKREPGNQAVSEKTPEPEPGVHFEQLKNGKFFNLCINDEKIFMDYKEVLSLLKIARAAENPVEAAGRLYNWLSRERKDVLVDGHIGSSGSPVLKLLYRELLEGFEA